MASTVTYILTYVLKQHLLSEIQGSRPDFLLGIITRWSLKYLKLNMFTTQQTTLCSSRQTYAFSYVLFRSKWHLHQPVHLSLFGLALETHLSQRFSVWLLFRIC